jgi:signal transduction histidine kinase
MFQQDRWPFVPVRLSEIIDPERLAVIEAGCSARLGRALTILDYEPEMAGFAFRIDSINVEQRWDGFCALLRDPASVQGGDNACAEYDLQQAKASLEDFRKNGALFRSFSCHMGLRDATYVVRVGGQPAALLYTGQHRPIEGAGPVVANVEALGSGRYEKIWLDPATRAELVSLAQALPQEPPDFQEALQREAELIQKIAEAEYSRGKYQWEQAFLDQLRRVSVVNGPTNLDGLRWQLGDLLAQVRDFCRCGYALFFASVQEGDTVLAPIAWAGIPVSVETKLPHFNWKKAGLSTDAFDARMLDPGQGCQQMRASGIRGDNSAFFAQAGCVMPVALGNRYRGALAFGPFAEPPSFDSDRRFLAEIADTVGSFGLTALEVRYLEQERRRWQSTARLLTHQLRTALTPITTQVGRAKSLAQKMTGNTIGMRVVDLLSRAEDLSLHLAESARQTLAGHVLQLEADDLEFELYPLSVLAANCADGFLHEAERRRRQLVVDKSVELLPEAEIDVARLTIAISNLIDNALKYSYPNTSIYVRGIFLSLNNPDLASAIIEVDDLGDEIPLAEREEIFEEGTRGLTTAKLGRIPGTGLGLWETRAVIEAHGGEIGVSCEPTRIQRSQGLAYRVIFSVKIPLRRRRSQGRSS